MKKIFTLAIIAMMALGVQAQTNKWWWNSVGNLVSASQWNPSDQWECDMYVVHPGVKYYDFGPNYDTANPVYNQVLAAPPADANGKQWYEIGYELTSGVLEDQEIGTSGQTLGLEEPMAIEWQRLRAPFTNGGTYRGVEVEEESKVLGGVESEIGDIYLRRSFTFEDGTILPSTIYLSCGHDDAPAEYYINGVLVWSVTDGWNNDEVVQLPSEYRALIKADGTENILAVHCHQNWGGWFVDCGLYGEPASYKFIVDTADRLPKSDDNPEGGWPGVLLTPEDAEYDGLGYEVGVGVCTIEYNEEYGTPIRGALANQGGNNENLSAYTQVDGGVIDVWVRRHFTIDEELPREGWDYYVIVGHDDVFTLWMNGSNGDVEDSYCYDALGNKQEGSGNRSYIPMPDAWINGSAADPHVVIPYTGNCWVDYPTRRVRKLTDEQLDLLNIGGDNVFTAHSQNTTGGYYCDMGIIGVQTKLPAEFFVNQLNDVLAEIAAIDKSVKTPAAIAAIEALVAEAQAVLADGSVSALNNMVGKINDFLPEYKAMNTSLLKATVAAAKKDYLREDFTELVAEAEVVLDEALKTSEINNAVSAIRVARRAAHAETAENVYTTAVPEVDGQYYLYNVGQKRFLCGGGDWGAHAYLGIPGVLVTLEYDAWGEDWYDDETGDLTHKGNDEFQYYAIDTDLSNSDWDSWDHLGHNGFMDTTGNAWMFWPQANGTYTISRNGTGDGDNTSNGDGTKLLLGFEKGSAGNVNTDCEGADDPDNQWILVTKEQREAILAAADETGVDATFYVQMPGFNQRERVAETNQSDEILPWEFECSGLDGYYYMGSDRHIIYDRFGNHDDFVIDAYELPAFKMSQQLIGIPNGNYRVTVKAAYRGAEDAEVVLFAETSETEVTTPIAPVAAGAGAYPMFNGESVYDVPTTGFEAAKFFQLGQYYKKVDVKVNDGVLIIGVNKNTEDVEGEALWIDDFRLIYFGDNEPSGIDELEAVKGNVSGRIYNINGQYEGKNVNNLQKGIHIVDGKKIVK